MQAGVDTVLLEQFLMAALLPDLAVASAVERLNKKGLGEGARQGLLAIAGLGELPPNPKPDVIVADLPGRIAQVLRVLCVIASVGSHFSTIYIVLNRSGFCIRNP